MIRININEAKTHLSRYLAKIAKGETIIICHRNVPVAEIRPLPPARNVKRPVGLAAGDFEVDQRFFEPLPDGEIAGFSGTEP
jgi:antitoxin (DNA-binding transcriptional repressor) of toxin-antitoxin stability system